MLQAYIGLISRHGMELFCPEDAATIRFLWRRAQRERGRSVCFWSVIPSDAVALIENTLNIGHSKEALDLLQQLSRDYGVLIPDQEEASPNLAIDERE